MNRIYAVIDLGTNNIQLLIAKNRKNPEIILKDSKISELGKNFKNNLIDNKKIVKAIEILNEYIKIAKEYTNKIIVVGTNLARKAKNIDIIKNFNISQGVQFKIISGKEEAYLNGIANIGEFGNCMLLFDIGGGSTEFTLIKNDNILKTISLPIGIRELDEEFCNLAQKKEKTLKILNSIKINDFNSNLVGIGGTVTSLIFLKNDMKKYEFDRIHKKILYYDEVTALYDDLVTIHIEKYKDSPIFKMYSLELIATGTMIVTEIMKFFKSDRFFISDKNLMFGVIKDEKYVF